MNTNPRLEEFVRAQNAVYEQVLRELAAGRKQTHWMWFIFPQLAGLGSSLMSRRFALASAVEARAYLEHSVLGPRLRECTQLLLETAHHNVTAILDSPDDLKFHSCTTLFAAAAPAEPLFQAALVKFFRGESDVKTIGLLQQAEPGLNN